MNQASVDASNREGMLMTIIFETIVIRAKSPYGAILSELVTNEGQSWHQLTSRMSQEYGSHTSSKLTDDYVKRKTFAVTSTKKKDRRTIRRKKNLKKIVCWYFQLHGTLQAYCYKWKQEQGKFIGNNDYTDNFMVATLE